MKTALILLFTLATGSLVQAQTDGPAGGRLDAPRVTPLDADRGQAAQSQFLAPDNRTAAGRVVNEDSAESLNIFRTLARHPELVKGWTPFAAYIMQSSTLPPREREIAILRIGWLCQSDYEFGQHTRVARQLDMTDAEIRAITVGADAPLWSPFERTLLRAVDELHEGAFIESDTWDALAEHYTEQQIMDFVFTVGQYTLVSMALNSLGVEREPGVPGFPAAE